MAASHPYYKAPELHRLNRREYRNAVRDLLGVDVDVSALLPPDARTGSFDNLYISGFRTYYQPIAID